MFGRNAAEAPVRGREDPVPPNPFTGRQCTGGRAYSNVAPGFRRGLHDHNVEQVRHAGGQEKAAGRGCRARGGARKPRLHPVRSGAGHRERVGDDLVYVTTATPVVSALAAYDTGQLRAEAENEEEA